MSIRSIEVGEVGIDLKDPVGLDQYDTADIYSIISL